MTGILMQCVVFVATLCSGLDVFSGLLLLLCTIGLHITKNNHQTAPAFVSATYSEERTEVKSERGRYAQPSILLQNTGKNVSRLNIGLSYVCNVLADDGPAYDREDVRAKSLAFLDNV